MTRNTDTKLRDHLTLAAHRAGKGEVPPQHEHDALVEALRKSTGSINRAATMLSREAESDLS